MTFTYSSVVDSPIDEVFAWHERPGALERLLPPWLPLRVIEESGTLESGRAVLRLPGGLRLVAQHGGYDPPHGFVDDVMSRPVRWQHVHDFAEVADGSTRVTDRVDTQVPPRLLQAVFAWRHQQLADDLAAQRRLSALGAGSMTVAVTGSSGLIGSGLTAWLSAAGHRVIRLVRRPAGSEAERTWAPDDPQPAMLAGVDAVVHLAGASIAGRFTEGHKRAIRDSRVGPTRKLAEAMASRAGGPRVLVCASAIGFYGADRGDAVLDEESARGDGLLAELVDDWEAATRPASEAGVRVVNVRTGLVQSPRGGLLRLLRPLFLAGLGGRLGSGQQWWSWIDIDDVTDVYARALADDELSGPVNAVAPHPVRNLDYTATLARVVHRPAPLPVPDLGPQLLLGPDGAREVAQASQRVQPRRLAGAGHTFRRPTLEPCLRHQLGYARLPGGAP